MYKYNRQRVLNLLDYLVTKKQKPFIVWDSFVIPSERGKHVEEYMKEMRDNDRLQGLKDGERIMLSGMKEWEIV